CQSMRGASGLHGADGNAGAGFSDSEFVSVTPFAGTERIVWSSAEVMPESWTGAIGTCGVGRDQDASEREQRSIDEVQPDEEKRDRSPGGDRSMVSAGRADRRSRR